MADEEHILRMTGFPPGWDEKRVQRVLRHYEKQTEEQAVAEDEAASRTKPRRLRKFPLKRLPEDDSDASTSSA